MPKPGECYVVAFHFMIENPLGKKATLVHGKVFGRATAKEKKHWIDHAWVELWGLVYDGSLSDTPIPEVIYYKKLTAKPEKKYTYKEALMMAVKTRHYGDWHTGWEKK